MSRKQSRGRKAKTGNSSECTFRIAMIAVSAGMLAGALLAPPAEGSGEQSPLAAMLGALTDTSAPAPE